MPLLASAVLTVATFRLLLWIVPLRRLRNMVDRVPLRPDRQNVDPARVGRAVSGAGHRIPYADCLPRALATQYLLRRRGIVSNFCIGVRSEAGAFTAHAWITCNDKIVIGQLDGPGFSELKRAG